METINSIAPAPKPKRKTARKVQSKTPKPGAKAAHATTIDLQPMNDSDVEVAASDEEGAEQSTQTTGQKDARRDAGQGLTDLPDHGSLDAVQRCATCHDTDTTSTCTETDCEMPVYIKDNGAGCINLLDGTMEANGFVCPRCLRAKHKPMPYKTESHVHHTYQHTENPLWAAFLSLEDDA